MEIRAPEPDEADRIQEVVDSSMTTTFRLSPGQIDAITNEELNDEAVAAKIEDDETVLLIAETGEDIEGEAIAGFVEGSLVGDGEWGELNWLFVDPEHRGRGIGTALYEGATDALRERGADHVCVTVLEANTEGHQFVERFGLEHEGDRRVEIAEESFVKYVYADPDADLELPSEADDEDAEEGEFPETEETDGELTATTDGGETVYIARDEEESGTAASFYTAYEDADHAEQFGFYCANCGSLDISLDNMDRLECGDCGNSHASRSGESYDDSYL
ncbi:GNAT family N-acetyltransferase [Halopiger aswanensis]|uniref:Ribosomal protein S18 acetylase RimI-like enzyme n=1 Tax=Halopiger aswanensis TaxID=148449 RepID=A0A3R7GLV0_9EURY|nr:GNAT family N-acetyltransferase [Halopiger aswanensis]RKD98247.1 ribosomal protein S18 acetylase RimI-like enzyme [Halopiger aswanensis]